MGKQILHIEKVAHALAGQPAAHQRKWQRRAVDDASIRADPVLTQFEQKLDGHQQLCKRAHDVVDVVVRQRPYPDHRDVAFDFQLVERFLNLFLIQVVLGPGRDHSDPMAAMIQLLRKFEHQV